MEPNHAQLTETNYLQGENSEWQNLSFSFAVKLGYSEWLKFELHHQGMQEEYLADCKFDLKFLRKD